MQFQGEITNRLLRGFTGDVSMAAGSHPLDLLIAWLSRRSMLFSRGWGDESLLKGMSETAASTGSMPSAAVRWQTQTRRRGELLRDGTFPSPLAILPEPTQVVHLRSRTREGNTIACVLLAGSRDEGYAVRERVFGALVARGLDLYFVESPYYGRRRTPAIPPHITVADHSLLALGMVVEARSLLVYLRARYQKLVVAGYSMGGHMAAITAAVTPFPVACGALATGASASSIYTRGLLSWSVDLNALGGTENAAAAQRRLHELFEAADVTRYAPPVRTDAAVIAGCTRDGYILRKETERLHQYWPGSTLRWLQAGHFSALVTSRRALCDCVMEAAEKL